MKMVVGFFIGIIVCLVLVLTIGHFTSTVKADDSPTTLPDGTDTGALMPDVGKIYREALGGPYRQVASEIGDPEIASYYRTFMDRTGLDKIGTP
jgi:hypothetical protein